MEKKNEAADLEANTNVPASHAPPSKSKSNEVEIINLASMFGDDEEDDSKTENKESIEETV